MNLADLWFVIIAVFWTGFFVLEGFDFGVGAIHSVVGRSETERRVAINTVGPFWDGNEVWLVVGAAAIFAAFPAWYATWISASYLAIVLLLVALIVRGISFEWRGRGRGDGWRWGWSLCLTLGSIVAPTVLGIALGDLLAGLPIDSDGNFTGTFWSLFTGFGVWTGLTVLALCLLQGSTFLALRTTDAVRGRARTFGHVVGFVDLGHGRGVRGVDGAGRASGTGHLRAARGGAARSGRVARRAVPRARRPRVHGQFDRDRPGGRIPVRQPLPAACSCRARTRRTA